MLEGVLFATSVAFGACETPVTGTALTARLIRAESAYADADAGAFTTSLDLAATELPCVSSQITPDLAAHYHRLRGLRFFLDGQDQRARLSFASARRIEPDADFATRMFPDGHIGRELYRDVPVESFATVEVAPPRRGWLLFDGIRGTTRPTALPTLVQVVGDDGQVISTAYVLPEDGLPFYEPKPTIGARKKMTPARIAGLSIGAGLAVASGASYGWGAATAAEFRSVDFDEDENDLLRMRRRANSLGSTALGLGSTSAVVLVGTWVIR